MNTHTLLVSARKASLRGLEPVTGWFITRHAARGAR